MEKDAKGKNGESCLISVFIPLLCVESIAAGEWRVIDSWECKIVSEGKTLKTVKRL